MSYLPYLKDYWVFLRRYQLIFTAKEILFRKKSKWLLARVIKRHEASGKNINQELQKSCFMLQNWELRPFRGYYGDGRIAIAGLQAVSRAPPRSLVEMTLFGSVLWGNTSSPGLDHLRDNRRELPKPGANGDALDDRHDDRALN